MALHSLSHSCQVAALTKSQHLKIVRWHRDPLPAPYALYEYINVDNCERPLSQPLPLLISMFSRSSLIPVQFVFVCSNYIVIPKYIIFLLITIFFNLPHMCYVYHSCLFVEFTSPCYICQSLYNTFSCTIRLAILNRRGSCS